MKLRPRAYLVSIASMAACLALFTANCSVDERGFGGLDGGLGGTGGTGGTSATGGATASGGAPGTAGVSGSGASPGTGGAHASGGASGSGGKGGGKAGSSGKGGSGTGGAGGVGSGGAASGGLGGGEHEGGSGGKSAGTGGAAGKGGGRGGQGGQGSDEICDQLVDDYGKELAAQRACTPGGTGQCQDTASSTLSYCDGCPQVVVNDATRLKAIRSQWLGQGCSTSMVCPAIACVTPATHTCAADMNAPGGTCEATGIVSN